MLFSAVLVGAMLGQCYGGSYAGSFSAYSYSSVQVRSAPVLAAPPIMLLAPPIVAGPPVGMSRCMPRIHRHHRIRWSFRARCR